MPSEFDRLSCVLDIDRMAASKVAVFGTGASLTLCVELALNALGAVDLYDKDTVEVANIGRQGFTPPEVGMRKVDAVAARLKAIRPTMNVTTNHGDILAIDDEEARRRFTGVDLIIAATDHFPVQARANEIALMLKIPVILVGVYLDAMRGEVVFWTPKHISCYRCLIIGRYRAFYEAIKNGQDFDPPGDGVTLLDMLIVDSIAGQVALGILTAGADNRFGTLIQSLGDRNYLQVSLRPEYRGVRRMLEVPDGNDAFFSWCTAARRDPSPQPCADCERYRGHRFVRDDVSGAWQRIAPN